MKWYKISSIFEPDPVMYAGDVVALPGINPANVTGKSCYNVKYNGENGLLVANMHGMNLHHASVKCGKVYMILWRPIQDSAGSHLIPMNWLCWDDYYKSGAAAKDLLVYVVKPKATKYRPNGFHAQPAPLP